MKYVNEIIQRLALIFDINYKSSFKILKQEQYVEKSIDKFKFKDRYTQEEIIDVKNKINEYICNKISQK